MTTDGIIELQRDVNVLLELDTFQDMTDAEIQSIIDFYKEVAANEARDALAKDAQFIAAQNMMNARIEQTEAATNVLQSMLEIEIPWVRVGDK